MVTIHTILCPVDFSDATRRQVALAASITRLFGARLVLHHNESGLALGSGVGWMWSGDNPALSGETVGLRLEALANEAAPGLEVQLSITEGSASSSVIAVSEAVNADLVVLTTHQATTEEHTSVATAVLKRTHRSVLALHDVGREPHTLQFDADAEHPQVTLVPTDLTPESRAAVDFAFELARTLPLELHLLHFTHHLKPAKHRDQTDADITADMRALIPEAFVASTHVHLREGEPGSGIVQAAAELSAACIVMGEHTRAPLRRWFSSDTSGGVLHEAPCPVWYVGGQRTA